MAKPEKRIVWTTKRVLEATKKLDEGYILPNVEIPFFEKTIGLRKSGITFGFTDNDINGNELEEYTKCKVDINYFANNYCFIKSEDGAFHKMRLRDYQYDIINLYDKNKLSILMASRQVGKCFYYNTTLDIYNKKTKVYKKLKFFQLLYKIKKNRTIYDYMKYIIYVSISWLDSR